MSKPKEMKTLETIIDRDVPFEKRAEFKKSLKKLMGESGSSKGAISDTEMKAMKDAFNGSGRAGGGVKGASEAGTPKKKRTVGEMMRSAKGKASEGVLMTKRTGKAAGGVMNGMMMRAKGKAAGGAMKSKAKSSPVRAPSSKNSGLYGR